MNKLNILLRILREDKRPLRSILGKILLRYPSLVKFFPNKLKIQDYYIKFHPSSLSIAFWCDPSCRSDDYNFITKYLKRNDIYFDVGANIGTTLIPAGKSVGKEGTAIGFEPHPIIFSYLKNNITLNKLTAIEIYNSALGNSRGYLTFSDDKVDDMNHVQLEGKGMKVPVMLWDDIGKNYDRINLLKIDIEGFEKFLLEGGPETLKKTDCVYFELFEEHYLKYEYSIKDLLEIFEKFGFHLFIKSGPERIFPINSGYRQNKGCENALAIRNTIDFIKRTGWKIDD